MGGGEAGVGGDGVVGPGRVVHQLDLDLPLPRVAVEVAAVEVLTVAVLVALVALMDRTIVADSPGSFITHVIVVGH